MKKVFLPLLLVASIAVQAQKVSNKIGFQKGQKLEVTTQVASVATQEMMGQTMDVNVAATLNHSYDVEDVTGGNAVIEHNSSQGKDPGDKTMDESAPSTSAEKGHGHR